MGLFQPRYALFFAPATHTELWRLGSQWLGRDAATGEVLGAPFLPEMTDRAAQEAITQEPRRYGFHATLKAPFYLAPDQTVDDLQVAVAAFASRHRPIMAPPLRVTRLGSFVALTLAEPSTAVEQLAAACVAEFDIFRAPIGHRELKRRLAMGLTPAQEETLRRWGYPFVFGEYVFHLTLTGKLPPREIGRVIPALEHHFQAAIDRPWALDSIALFRQERESAPFVIEKWYPFGESDVLEQAAFGSVDGEADLP